MSRKSTAHCEGRGIFLLSFYVQVCYLFLMSLLFIYPFKMIEIILINQLFTIYYRSMILNKIE
jgi:hypothetical protein